MFSIRCCGPGLRSTAKGWWKRVLTAEHRSFSQNITYGSKFVEQGRSYEQLRQKIEEPMGSSTHGSFAGAQVADPETRTREQIRLLLHKMPGSVSSTFAYSMHKKERLEPRVSETLEFEEFQEIFTFERQRFYTSRRFEVTRRRRKRRNHFLNNTGYKDEEPVYEAEQEEFQDKWRVKSMAEDCWKAEYYQYMHRHLRETIPEREPLAVKTDRFADILASALRSDVARENRPVLTHELADFENPYMMKRSALHRVFSERCVRNQLDERCLPKLLDMQPDLVKLRSKARLPPEVLEPLAAFRGDTNWSFDSCQRLGQKIEGASTALSAVVEAQGEAGAALDTLSATKGAKHDKKEEGPTGFWAAGASGAEGFESTVPRGLSGGLSFGQPENRLDARTNRLRYPTLQKVAHTLPEDDKYRAHAVRTIRVLERSKGWDMQNKLKAVNNLKEVYDEMKPSAFYTSKLDENLPLNRVASHLWRKYAPDKQYVKTYPKRFLRNKTHKFYRQSLTATKPMSKTNGT